MTNLNINARWHKIIKYLLRLLKIFNSKILFHFRKGYFRCQNKKDCPSSLNRGSINFLFYTNWNNMSENKGGMIFLYPCFNFFRGGNSFNPLYENNIFKRKV